MESSLLSGGLRQKSISRVIIDRIVRSIVSGELAPGTKLPPEDEFAARLCVGRSSVREAMKILEAFGVVDIRRANGVYISSAPNPQQVDPMVIGALSSGAGSEHIIDFLIRMQGMVVQDLADPRAHGGLEECSAHVEELFKGNLSAEEVAKGVLDVAGRLAGLIENPIIATLFRRSLQIGAIQLEHALLATGESAASVAGAFFSNMLSALKSSDKEEAMRLLESERAFLLA